jgi:hypothetical protein
MEITFALKEPKKLVVLSLHGDIDLLPKFLTITHIIFVQYEVLELIMGSHFVHIEPKNVSTPPYVAHAASTPLA